MDAPVGAVVLEVGDGREDALALDCVEALVLIRRVAVLLVFVEVLLEGITIEIAGSLAIRLVQG